MTFMAANESSTTPIIEQPDDVRRGSNTRFGVIICGGRRHMLFDGSTVGKTTHSDTDPSAHPSIELPDFSIYGDCISPIHGEFKQKDGGWWYYNRGERGSRILRHDTWICVKEDGVLLEDADQIELGNGANDAEGVFEHLFFELQ